MSGIEIGTSDAAIFAYALLLLTAALIVYAIHTRRGGLARVAAAASLCTIALATWMMLQSYGGG
jgi:hypothetical protein